MSWIIRVCFLALISASIMCLKVNFERGGATYVNHNYFKYVYANVTRYGRKSNYYINLVFEPKYLSDNNITVNILFYELRRNEYRRSFLEFHSKLCDFLENDPYIGLVGRTAGLRCPLPPKKYTLMNLTAPLENFPNVFPFEKGRIDFNFNATSNGETLAEGVLFLSFKNEGLGKKNG